MWMRTVMNYQARCRAGRWGRRAGCAALTHSWLRPATSAPPRPPAPVSPTPQYANGGSLGNALSVLWKEGGIGRLYKGVGFAIIQNPLSRFGDTAANTGVLAVMAAFFPDSPVALQTALASVGGATWRIGLTPIDTFKTTLQVQGNAAFDLLKQKVARGGVGQARGGGRGCRWLRSTAAPL